MMSDTPWNPALVEEMGIDAFIASVIRTHERVQRSLRRLATERLWLADTEAQGDCQLIKTTHLGNQR